MPRSGRTSATIRRRRLDALGRDEPANLGALQLAIVAGYYTDAGVRERIGYPGQMALTLRSWEVPAYIDEGLIDTVLARGPVWRDPATGVRAVATDAPRTYAERFADAARRREPWPRRHLRPRKPAGWTRSSPTGAPARASRARRASPRPGDRC